MMRIAAVALAAALATAPLGAECADLVVWWEEGYTVEEDEAVVEIIAAFEQESGKQVELVLHSYSEFPDAIAAALEVDSPPDFAFGLFLNEHVPKWAHDDRLVDLSEAIRPFADLFDRDALDAATLLNVRSGRSAIYALPMGRSSNHLHVWKSVLEQAGLTLADIPRKWEAFWAFWCDKVQPAVRQATGTEDIYGVGLAMSEGNYDTWFQFLQFMAAYDANYVRPDGTLLIDNPVDKGKLVDVLKTYTAIYREGCTPPESVVWSEIDNNELFHDQKVVMTPNETLSVVNALKRDRPDDYYTHTASIQWPVGPAGESFPIPGSVFFGMAFRSGKNPSATEEFVSFLLQEGWLMHYLNFSAERMLPPMATLSDQPFWLDPSDPHRMAAAIQLSSRPLAHDYAAYGDDWRIWTEAIHRVAIGELTPEQAVDETIARVKQILSE